MQLAAHARWHHCANFIAATQTDRTSPVLQSGGQVIVTALRRISSCLVGQQAEHGADKLRRDDASHLYPFLQMGGRANCPAGEVWGYQGGQPARAVDDCKTGVNPGGLLIAPLLLPALAGMLTARNYTRLVAVVLKVLSAPCTAWRLLVQLRQCPTFYIWTEPDLELLYTSPFPPSPSPSPGNPGKRWGACVGVPRLHLARMQRTFRHQAIASALRSAGGASRHLQYQRLPQQPIVARRRLVVNSAWRCLQHPHEAQWQPSRWLSHGSCRQQGHPVTSMVPY